LSWIVLGLLIAAAVALLVVGMQALLSSRPEPAVPGIGTA
jgi:hypothetical protein